MKYFLKVFSMAFLVFMLMVGSGLFMFNRFYDPTKTDDDIANELGSIDKETELKSKSDENLTPFKKTVMESKRINVLLLGMEGSRSDVMMFVSFDPKTKKIDVISIPRDTYYWDKGYNLGGQRKINAKYGRSGIKGLKNTLGKNILGGKLGEVPIHHYVKITYKGVEKIVDSIGGVEVNVPFHMKYEDTTLGRPPLYIDIPKGRQVLNGEEAVKYLRYRRSNDRKTGYKNGDLGRIKTQQQFIKSAMKKSLSLKIFPLIKTAFKVIDTDMTLKDMLYYGRYALGMKTDNISLTTLPGSPRDKIVGKKEVSYFYHDPKQVEMLIKKLYNVEKSVH